MTEHIIPPDNLDEIARKFGLGKYASVRTAETPKQPLNNLESGEFSVAEIDDRYLLQHVRYGDGFVNVGICKNLIDNGVNHTQEQFRDLTKSSEAKVGSSSLWASIINTLFDNKDGGYAGLVERIKGILVNDFDPKKPWMMTSTRVKYTPSGDIVVPDYCNDDSETINSDIVGDSTYLEPNQNLEPVTKALLGIEDIAHFKESINWLTGKRPHLRRLNSKPPSETERAVVLGANVNDFDINVIGVYISNDVPARGVVVGAEKKTP